MCIQTFEEARLTPEQMGTAVNYIKEEMEADVLFWNDQVLEVQLPTSVML